MICPKCGNEINESSTFCIKCGTKLQEIQQDNSVNEINNNNNKSNLEIKKTGNNKKIIIIIIAVIILAVVGIVLFKILIPSKKESKSVEEELNNSTSFFVENSDKMYALFNIDGKQITDYEFTIAYEFVNNSSLVTNKNGDSGVISSTGKPIIKYGVCKYLTRYGSFYKCVDSEYNDTLYTSTGKAVIKRKNLDVTSYIGENTYILAKYDNKYTVYDYQGNDMTSFPVSEDKNVKNPEANSDENYVTVFYNNVNYIFNIKTSKLILSFEDKSHYCVTGVNKENNDEIILKTCTQWYEKNENKGIKFVKNGKVIYTKTPEGNGNLIFDKNNVIYNDGNNKYLLDEKGNNTIKTYYTIYKDYKNYIVKAEKGSNGADLYVNEKKKEHFNCNTIETPSISQDVYLLQYCSGYGDGKHIYINYDGTRINNKSYKYAEQFDKNGYAEVSEDKINFYLINLKGEKVSDVYTSKYGYGLISSVEGSDDLYIYDNREGQKELFRVNDKKLLAGESITTHNVNNTIYAIVKNNDKYTIYNTDKNKEVITLNEKPSTYKNYFTIKKNSKTQYYSFITGKMFYEE